MKFNKSIAKRFAILMFICLIYPYFKQRQTLSFVAFVDALTIEGFVLFIMGLIVMLFNSGAFSSISYVAQRSFFKYKKDYETYIRESKENKAFNYSLYLGIYCILLSLILSLFA